MNNVIEQSFPTLETNVIEESSSRKTLPTAYDLKKEAKPTVLEAIDDIYEIEEEDIENVEDSSNFNSHITQIQKLNSISNNDMLPKYERKTTSEKLEQEIDLPSDKINHLIDYHLEVIIEKYRQLWIEVNNRMIRKMYEENPGWSLDKIITTIWSYNEERGEYIPFNKAEIKKHLDTENKELFGIFKKDKSIQDMKSIEDMR